MSPIRIDSDSFRCPNVGCLQHGCTTLLMNLLFSCTGFVHARARVRVCVCDLHTFFLLERNVLTALQISSSLSWRLPWWCGHTENFKTTSCWVVFRENWRLFCFTDRLYLNLTLPAISSKSNQRTLLLVDIQAGCFKKNELGSIHLCSFLFCDLFLPNSTPFLPR